MKAKLNTEITFKTITIHLDSTINFDDRKTHMVIVNGHLSHSYLWEKDKQQQFEIGLHADKDLCDAIVKLVEGTLQARDVEQFPKGD